MLTKDDLIAFIQRWEPDECPDTDGDECPFDDMQGAETFGADTQAWEMCQDLRDLLTTRGTGK